MKHVTPTTRMFFIALILVGLLLPNWALAGCWVEDSTFYAKNKRDMTVFAIYMDQGKKADALRMVDDVDFSPHLVDTPKS